MIARHLTRLNEHLEGALWKKGFPQGLARGLAEGFYSPLRRDLNTIAARSREAYNSFARAANGV